MKKMDFNCVSSLEDRTLVQIATTLWDFGGYTRLLHYSSLSDSCKRKMLQETLNKVQKLELPILLSKKLARLVVEMGEEKEKWIKCFEPYVSEFGEVAKFHWTSQGTVDMKNTMKVLVDSPNIEISLRYKLACTFCFESNIRTLWNQLHRSEMDQYLQQNGISGYVSSLESFWTYYMAAEVVGTWEECCANDSPYEYAFQHSVKSCNEVAARYFLKKLTVEQKDRTLMQLAECFLDMRVIPLYAPFRFELYKENVLWFLFSAMNEQQQMELLRSHKFALLKLLMNWPMQDFLIPTVQRIWTYISACDYYELLSELSYYILYDIVGCHYKSLLYELWQQSPVILKRQIFGECSSFFLVLLSRIRDKDCILLILKDATDTEKENIISSALNRRICIFLEYDIEWDLLEFLVKKCISTKEAKVKLRDKFKVHLMHDCLRKKLKKQKCDNFLQLLDDLCESKFEKE